MGFGDKFRKLFESGNVKDENLKSQDEEETSPKADNSQDNDIKFDFGYLDNLIHQGDSKHFVLSRDIRFENYESDFYEGGVILDIDGLVIDGNGKTIDGANKSRIFIVTGRNITLKNITFKNGCTHLDLDAVLFNDGGAVFVQIGASLNLINCKFINNVSQWNGGAIVNYGRLNSKNNVFKDNYSKRFGGAIVNYEVLALGEDRFEGNHSQSAAAIFNRNYLRISDDIVLLNNESDDSAPPILNNNLIEIDNVELNFDESVYGMGRISQYSGHEDSNENPENASGYHTIKRREWEKRDSHNHLSCLSILSDEDILETACNEEEMTGASYNEVYSNGWKYAIIFISSTFNDMHAERDYLVKEVFPELSELCEKRRIRLIDVDLRWGVRREDAENKATLGTCLHHIDNSRPFFVGFLGQRRGWVPDFDKDIDDDTKRKYPQIVDMDDKSITEMEIEHSLLSPLFEIVGNEEKMPAPNRYSLFFFRDDDYTNNISDHQRLIYTNDDAVDVGHANYKLNEIKERIYEREWAERKANECREEKDKIYVNVFEYGGTWDEDVEIPELYHFENSEWKGGLTDFKCGDEPLKDVIIRQLMNQISIEFPDNEEFKSQGDFEENLNKEEIFCFLNSEGFIPRPEYGALLRKYVTDSKGKPCLVVAEAGYGKTMLLANFSMNFQSKYRNKKLFKRFCGASNFSSNAYSLWKSIIDEADIDMGGFYPNNLDELKINFEYVLKAISDKSDSVIIIDAINQMIDGEDMLRWLGRYDLPDNLKIIISVKKDSAMIAVEPGKFYAFEIKGLDEPGKRRLINQYLGNYLKTLDDEQIDVICSFEASENPLFLKVLLSELRVFGSFDQLSEEIGRFGNSPVSAFKHVLDRLESDGRKTNIVPLMFSLLANARAGLAEDELVDIIKSQTDFDENDIRDAIRLNIMKVRQFMMRKDGCHDFFYDSFKIASREKYGDKNDLLLDYFNRKADPYHDFSFANPDENNLRALNELPFHLNSSGDYEELEKVLGSYAFMKNKLELSDVYNLISDYHFGQDHEFHKVENHPIALIGNALELSAQVLTSHKDQLPAQLWGRLKGIENGIIGDLLDELIAETDNLWFKSKEYSLYSPYSPIIKKLGAFPEKSVTDIVFFPDKKIIWGNDDGTLNLYDFEDDYYEVLSTYDSGIIKIFFGDDLDLFIVYANGRIVKFDIYWREIICAYPRIEVEITDVHYSRTYEKLFISSNDGLFSIDLRTYELRREDIESKNFNQFLIPPVLGHILVCDERDVDGWDIYEQRSVYRQRHCFDKGYGEGIMNSNDDIVFMACIDRFLILISYGGEQKIWNMAKTSKSEPIDICHTVSSLDNFNNAVAFEDSRRIMVLSQMGRLNFWNLPNPRNPIFKSGEGEQGINEIQTGISFPSAIAEYWCGEENWIVIGNEKNNIYLVDLDKSHNYKKHNGAVLHIAIDGDVVITCSDDGGVFVWNFDSCKFKSEFSNDLRVACASYDFDDKIVISAGFETQKDGRIINKINVLDVTDEKVDDYIACSDTVIDVAHKGSDIIFIETKRLVMDDDEICFDRNATSLARDLNGNGVFVGFEDGSIVKYPNGLGFDSPVKRPIIKMKIFEDNLVAGYVDGDIEIFDLDGNHLNSLEGHDGEIKDICSFEKYLISASMDNTLKLWDIEDNYCVYTHYLDIPATAINVKDGILVLGDGLGNVRFFDFENF